MAAHPQPRLTPEQYLEIERAAEFRSEYFNGHMYAMSGGSPRHAFIIGNCIGELHNALRKSPCRIASSDLRVRVSPGGLYTYPDIVVICDELRLADNRNDTLLNPVLIVEVLSPSTEAYDRGFKFTQYRKLESLQEYALVSQDEPRVEVFRRQPSGEWLLAEYAGMDARCILKSVDCAIALAELYDKIDFAPVPTERPSAAS